MTQRRRFTLMSRPFDYQTPSAAPQRPLKRTFGSYFNRMLWRSLMQYATQHHYWMRAVAIAYGLLFFLLLSGLALLAAASLSPEFQDLVMAGFNQWSPRSLETVSRLITQTATEWQPSHRWLLLSISSGLALGIWLKIVGSAQQMLQPPNPREPAPAISIRQRLSTVLLALVSALLTMLAYGLVFIALPTGIEGAIADAPIWNTGRHLMAQALRWSLALSTMSLMFGVFYRGSLRFAANSQPILPGTMLATLMWAALSVLLKVHVSSWPNHHWLYSVISTVTLLLLTLYCSTCGLLLGGRFSLLMNVHFPDLRSRSQTVAIPPPPSFESFTIHRGSDKRL